MSPLTRMNLIAKPDLAPIRAPALPAQSNPGGGSEGAVEAPFDALAPALPAQSVLGGGREERADRRATTVGRGAKPPSEVTVPSPGPTSHRRPRPRARPRRRAGTGGSPSSRAPARGAAPSPAPWSW